MSDLTNLGRFVRWADHIRCRWCGYANPDWAQVCHQCGEEIR